MNERVMPDIQTALRVTDSHNHRISQLEKDSAVHGHQIASLERASQEMCMQLKTTEVRVMDSQKLQNDKLDKIIANELRREGAANFVKWIPIFIQIFVGVTVIWAFLSK